jgi:glycosyltransferase involved in cell wall biosynthesis
MIKNSKQNKVYFSILMANYNNAQYIEDAILSVLNQTYPYWELIIVDDNSLDESINMIKKYLNTSNIKLIRHRNNLGYGGSLKTAVQHANGEILCICDADDKLHKKALEVLAAAYSEFLGFGFIYTNMWICDSNLENCRPSETAGPIDSKKTTVFNHRVFHLKSFRREIYENTVGFEISQKRSVDKDIIYKLEEVTDFKFIDQPLYYYRRHQSGISQFENQPEAFFYHYIAKHKTYWRRLNTDLPNFSKGDLYKDYFIITFKSILNLRKKLFNFFKINIILVFIQKRYPNLILAIKKNLSNEPFKSFFQSLF